MLWISLFNFAFQSFCGNCEGFCLVEDLGEKVGRKSSDYCRLVLDFRWFLTFLWYGSFRWEENFLLQKQELSAYSSIMAKRFLKQPARAESDDAGCLSGFIGIFDFHVGHYTQKLLSDKKHGSSGGLATGYLWKKLDFPSNLETKHEDVDGGDGSRENGIDSGIVSVKTLMEEEMSKTHITKIQKHELERPHSESRFGFHLKEKNNKKSKKKGNVVPDHVNGSRYANPTERSSMTNDLAEFMVQFYCDNQSHHTVQVDSEIDLCPLSESNVHRTKIHIDETDSQLSEKYFVLQKALCDVAKVFLSQKLVDSNELVSNAAVHSKEFMDALDILSSNKELLVNIMQDPSSQLLKHVQDIRGALGSEILGEESKTSEKLEDSSSNEQFQMQSHKFSCKKNKPKGSDNSWDISKIVVLKPSPSVIQNNSVGQTPSSSPLLHHSLKHEGEQTKSYFSLKGIKRRLRKVLGESRKGQDPISMDDLLDRIPYGSKDSGDTQKSFGLASKNYCNTQQNSPPAVSKKREKSKLKIENPHSILDEEAKKHLTERVTTPDEKDSLPTVLKSSGRVVSLPECDLLSPRFSPGNDKELVLSPRKIIFSPSLQLNQESLMNHLSPLSRTLYQDAKTHVTESDQECIAEDLKPKGSIEIVESSDITSLEKHDNLDALTESIGNEPVVLCEVCMEEGSTALLELETPNGKPQLAIPFLSISPKFLHGENLENPDNVLEKPERPSPVSVLEPFFLEDIISPVSTAADHVDLPLQPQQIDFRDNDDSAAVTNSSDVEGKQITWLDEQEVVYGFVRTVLQSCGVSCYRILERWNSSHQLLNPSEFEEVGIMHGLLLDDSKLLFDCIYEVLVDTRETLFGSTPWVSLIKPSSEVILRGVEFVEEVCKSVYGHLQLSQFTLDHAVRKDIEGRSWMDHRLEIEDIVIEMTDDVLEEILKETMYK